MLSAIDSIPPIVIPDQSEADRSDMRWFCAVAGRLVDERFHLQSFYVEVRDPGFFGWQLSKELERRIRPYCPGKTILESWLLQSPSLIRELAEASPTPIVVAASIAA